MTFDAHAHPDLASLLSAWMAVRPRQRSARALAARLDLSHTFVSQVKAGERLPRPADAEAWARAMALEPDEAAYLECLVRAGNSATEGERQSATWEAAARRVLARSGGRQLLPLFASLPGQVLAELARIGARVPDDPAALAALLRPPATAEEVEHGLAAVQDARMGDGAATLPRIRHPELARAVADLHRATLRDAERSLVEDAPDQRHFASLVVALPSSALPELEVRLRDALLHALGPWVDGAGADRIFQLSFQLVARTEPFPPAPGER